MSEAEATDHSLYCDVGVITAFVKIIRPQDEIAVGRVAVLRSVALVLCRVVLMKSTYLS